MHPWRFSGKNGHITEFCSCRHVEKNKKKRQKKSSRNTQKKNGWKHPQVATPTEEKKIDDHRLGGRAGVMCGRGDGLGY